MLAYSFFDSIWHRIHTLGRRSEEWLAVIFSKKNLFEHYLDSWNDLRISGLGFLDGASLGLFMFVILVEAYT